MQRNCRRKRSRLPERRTITQLSTTFASTACPTYPMHCLLGPHSAICQEPRAASAAMSRLELARLGQWRWLREFIDKVTVADASAEILRSFSDADHMAHVLQLAVEGGHWMLTPPRLLTLVHAVQQPLGRPEFIPLSITHVGWQSMPA